MSATITLTQKAAKDLKYTRLTEPYTLPKQQWMIDNVCADMRRGGIDHAIVVVDGEATVWRKSKRATLGNV